MNTAIYNKGFLGQSEPEIWSVSKWAKFIAVTLFAEAAVLFIVSFLLFFIKRTYDPDPRLISGAFSGTIQLTYFIAVNITAIILALQGYYLYYFKESTDLINENLRKFFKTAGITMIPLFIAVVTVLFCLIL